MPRYLIPAPPPPPPPSHDPHDITALGLKLGGISVSRDEGATWDDKGDATVGIDLLKKKAAALGANVLYIPPGEKARYHAAAVFASNDAREGPRAFAEKRAPNWEGR